MIRHSLLKWAGASILVAAASAALAAATAPPTTAPAQPPPAQPRGEHKHHEAPAGPGPKTGPVTPEQVTVAIEKAQKWLLAHRNKEGTWEEVPKPGHAKDDKDSPVDLKTHQWGGLTSIAAYALVASGYDYRSPELAPAVEFLMHANIVSTYGMGLSSQLTLYVPAKQSADLLKRNVAMFLAGMTQPLPKVLNQPQSWGKGVGFYSYWTGFTDGTVKPEFGKDINPKTIGSSQPKGGFDRSNSQYGVLGMWALAEAGGEVPTLYWQIEDAAWKKAQLKDGGWNYNSDAERKAEATPSMTAAGIATLFITQDYTLEENWKVCKGGVKNENIERGLHWMDQHIAQALSGELYTMYGIERIGTASGRKYFGTADWYKIGSEYLVRHQAADGSWAGGHGPIPSTAFGLVFLARGRAPVLMNKLEYQTSKAEKGVSDPWDERPRDVANLARWVGKEEETYLNWQVVNLQVPIEDLHDAPILYISGSQLLDFKKEEEDKLRQYVEQGGMILGNADCGLPPFAKSFMALGSKLFPKYEFKQTAPSDIIYTEQFKKFRSKPRLMELSNGVRKLMVLIPDMDPAHAWQTRSSSTREEAFGLGADIFLYAVDKKNLMAKGVTYLVHASPTIPTTSVLKVARLDSGDNPNPEPAGWARMIGVMHNTHKVDLKVDTVKPEALTGYKVADLTGTGKVSFSAAARSAIKQFVDGGGTLIVDAAGGDAEFADSAEGEIAAIFPDGKLDLLPENSAVYTQPHAMIDKIGWREFAVNRVADRKRPKLRGITVGKRVAVFMSREDLSGGLVGEPVDGIYGYDPATATNLMAAMLLYAQADGKPAAAPTTKPAETAER